MTPIEWLEHYASAPIPKSIQIEKAIEHLKAIGILDQDGKIAREYDGVIHKVDSRQEQRS